MCSLWYYLPVFVCCLGILFCNYRISKYSEGKVFGDTTFIPYNKVGLVVGYFSPGESAENQSLFSRIVLMPQRSCSSQVKIKYI